MIEKTIYVVVKRGRPEHVCCAFLNKEKAEVMRSQLARFNLGKTYVIHETKLRYGIENGESK